jgi:mono/diheme cytochrome c family protein
VAALAALAIVAGAAAEEGTITTLDGVFTSVQAKRGEAIYTGPCSRCHGYRLDGAPDDPDMLPAPPAAGTKFLRKWNCRSLAVLLEYLRATMPENNPGYLSDEEYTDLVTYMLSVSGMPAGSVELKAEKGALSRILMLGAESSTVKGACPRATRE